MNILGSLTGSIVAPITIIMLAVAFVLVVKYMATRYRRVPPGRVGIFYGKKYKWADGSDRGYLLVSGGGRFQRPFFESYLEIPTTAFQVPINEEAVPNKDNVKLTVPGVATCKVSTDPSDLNKAVDSLIDTLSADDPKARARGVDAPIEVFVRNILKGHLRSIIGKLSVNELLRERDAFNKKVVEESAAELKSFGVDLMNLVIQDIADREGYIDALGKQAVADAKAEAEIKVSNAQRSSATVKAQNEAEIAAAEKDRDIKKAEFLKVTATAQAEANMAGQIMQAAQEQRLKVAQAQRDAAEREALVQVQEKEAVRRTKELEATVVAQAKADQQTQVINAEAAKQKRIIDADAEAEYIKRTAQAKRDGATLEGEGEANRVRAKLLAEAEGNAAAKKQALLAEAEGTRQLAEALKQLSSDGRMIIIMDRLPLLIEKGGDAYAKVMQAMFSSVAAGVGAIDNLNVVDMGGSGAGVARVADLVPNIVARTGECEGARDRPQGPAHARGRRRVEARQSDRPALFTAEQQQRPGRRRHAGAAVRDHRQRAAGVGQWGARRAPTRSRLTVLRVRRKRPFPRSARVARNLPDRAEVIRQVRDARHHPREFHIRNLAGRGEHRQPSVRFATQTIADLRPRRFVDARRLPRLVPFRVRERVAALGHPPVHQRQSVAQVLRVRRDGGAVVHGARRLVCRQLVERAEQSRVARIEDEGATAGGGAVDQFGEQAGECGARVFRVHNRLRSYPLRRRAMPLRSRALRARSTLPRTGDWGRGLGMESALYRQPVNNHANAADRSH